MQFDAWKRYKESLHPGAEFVPDGLPDLALLKGRAERYDLILHLNQLFAYSHAPGHFGPDAEIVYQFHEQSLLSMADLLKPDGQARVYPTGTMNAEESCYPRLDDLRAAVESCGFRTELVRVIEPPNVRYWDTMLVIHGKQEDRA